MRPNQCKGIIQKFSLEAEGSTVLGSGRRTFSWKGMGVEMSLELLSTSKGDNREVKLDPFKQVRAQQKQNRI